MGIETRSMLWLRSLLLFLTMTIIPAWELKRPVSCPAAVISASYNDHNSRMGIETHYNNLRLISFRQLTMTIIPAWELKPCFTRQAAGFWFTYNDHNSRMGIETFGIAQDVSCFVLRLTMTIIPAWELKPSNTRNNITVFALTMTIIPAWELKRESDLAICKLSCLTMTIIPAWELKLCVLLRSCCHLPSYNDHNSRMGIETSYPRCQ